MSHPIEQLKQIMAQLRNPEGGCPWDLKQDFDTIVPHTIEETYEVVDAIHKRDWNNLKEELGDLLFQVIFYSQLANEKGLFDFDEVVEGVNEKLTRLTPMFFPMLSLKMTLKSMPTGSRKKPRRKKKKGSPKAVFWMRFLSRFPPWLEPTKFRRNAPNTALIGKP
ncbi:hypothetical protein TUMSATVNIG1_32140 [Vibrio nigripulchritudo]|nr:hypothetical protein TUMSATVNIG1_32140 [Vibrio nigripulchritudo]